MFKQSPSRNQRSRGIKVKHVLQICFLLAVCFWLIYQVKHSHDKKKEFDETDVKNSDQTQVSSEILKLGRKDLHPKVDETDTASTKQDEEAEENVGEEEDKNDEEEHADDNKSEEKEDEGGGVGDDEIDEHGDDKPEDEVDGEEDVTEEEKKEEVDEKENEEKESEDKSVHVDNDSSLGEHDDDDEKAHGAREEHYKADDASSAVTQESEDNSAENENGSSENSNELAGENGEQSENVANTEKNDVAEKTTGSKIEDREMTGKIGPSDTTANEDKENLGSVSDNGSSASNHLNQINNTTEASAGGGTNGLPTQNRVGKESENVTTENTTSGDGSGLHSIPLDQGKNYSLSSDANHTDTTITTSSKFEDSDSNSWEASKSNSSTLPTMSDKLFNSSNGAGDNSRYSTMETNNATEAEKAGDTSDGGATEADKSGNSSDGAADGTVDDPLKTENSEEVQNDPIDASDSSIGLVEKEVRTDLDTLPEIRTEGSHDEDAAEE